MDFLNVTTGQCFDGDFLSSSLAESDDSSSYFGGRLVTAAFCAGAVITSRIVSDVFNVYRFDLPRNIQRPLQIALSPFLIADSVLTTLFYRTIGSCLGVFRKCYRARQAKQIIQRDFPDLTDNIVKRAEVGDQKRVLAAELFEVADDPLYLERTAGILFVGNRVERHTISTFSLELKKIKYLCLSALYWDRTELSLIFKGQWQSNSQELSEINKWIKAYNGLISKIDDLLITAKTIQRRLESGREVTDTSGFESKHEAFMKEIKRLSHEKRHRSLNDHLPQLLSKLSYEPSYRARDVLDTATNMNNDQRKNIESRVRGVEFSAHRLRHLGGFFNQLADGVNGLIRSGRIQDLIQLHQDCMSESDPLARCKVFKKYMTHNIGGYKGCHLELIRLYFYREEHAEVRNRLTTGLSEIFEHFEAKMSDLNHDHLQYNPSPEEYFRQVRVATEENMMQPLLVFWQQNQELAELDVTSDQNTTERDYLRSRLVFLLCQFTLLAQGVRIQGAVDRNFMRDLVFEPTRGKEDFDRERGYLEVAEPAGAGA